MPRIPNIEGDPLHNRASEKTNSPIYSVHLPDELVDVDFPVTKVTALDVVLEFASPPSACRVGEFEWPQEVRRLVTESVSEKQHNIIRSDAPA
jgi:hypothetical protein